MLHIKKLCFILCGCTFILAGMIAKQFNFFANNDLKRQSLVASTRCDVSFTRGNFSKTLPHQQFVGGLITSVSDRIRAFNDALNAYRCRLLQETENSKQRSRSSSDLDGYQITDNKNEDVLPSKMRIIDYKFGVGYFASLRLMDLDKRLATIFLEWVDEAANPVSITAADGRTSRADVSKADHELSASISPSVPHYYRWTGALPPCKWYNHTGQFSFSARCRLSLYDDDKGSESTTPQTTATATAEAFSQPVVLDKLIVQKYRGLVSRHLPAYAFFIHVVRDVVITEVGDIVMLKSATMIRATGCQARHVHDNFTGKSLTRDFAVYDEVFVASQSWTRQCVYHRMVESFPKLAISLEFLQRNPSVRIHLISKDIRQIVELFDVLQLDVSRIVVGDIRAHVVYWPRPANCYEPPLPDINVLAYQLKRRVVIGSSTSRDAHVATPLASKDNVAVFIRRTTHRLFENQTTIEEAVRGLCQKHGFTLKIFTDNPVPPLDEIVRLFYSARLVVGGHGAGLTNMMFCRPGTAIVEVVDYETNGPCYLNLAHVMGMRYHAIPCTGGKHIMRVSTHTATEAIDNIIHLLLTTFSRI